MHPAYSVIVFTTASGAGYGLLFWLALLAALGFVPASRWLGLVGLGLSLVLITTGLLSSTVHLGRPERAWRALSQWRSSWLSREGLAAVVTYAPAGLLSIGWVFFERADGLFAAAAGLAAVLALVVVWCTGMIYASLPTIRAWHQPLVAPLYIVLALATGGVLVNLLLPAFGLLARWTPWLALLPLIAGWLLKVRYWSAVDTARKTFTVEQATGLGRFGKVRPLEPPHTQPNFVMREMGYQVARKHVQKLRQMAVVLLFLLPAVCSLLLLVAGTQLGLALAFVATVSAAAGVLIERWLFFAEAEHVVMLYYGRDTA
jgi:sulfite dehydrogenase (quinone) subunit SoeC